MRHVDLDSVVRPKDVFQVIDRIEDMNSNAAIKACRLQKPQVFALVFGRTDCEWGPDHLVERNLSHLKFRIKLHRWQVNILFEERYDLKNLLEFYTVVVILKVHCECQGDHIVDI